MKYIILSACLLLSSCFTRYSGIGYEKYDVKNLETKGFVIMGFNKKESIKFNQVEYINVSSGKKNDDIFIKIKEKEFYSTMSVSGKYVLNDFDLNIISQCNDKNPVEYNVQCVTLSAITQVDACSMQCNKSYKIYGFYNGLTLQGPSYASFDVNAGEIIYIGDLNYDNFGINYLDNYEEAVAWFYKEYPQFKDKPVIKRIATLGPYAKNISIKK